MSICEGLSGPTRGAPVIDGTLHLEVRASADVSRVLPDYVAACRAREIYELHIVHGIGDARARRAVESVLMNIKEVACFRSGGTDLDAHGETTVILLRPEELPPA
jgi:DNA-nicking Smr family endonuclease